MKITENCLRDKWKIDITIFINKTHRQTLLLEDILFLASHGSHFY